MCPDDCRIIVKNRRRRSENRLAYVVALTACVVLALIAMPPFVGPAGQSFLMYAFSSVCHQIPSRSPHIDGVSFAVCDRCTGLYLGIAAGSLAGLWLQGPRRFLSRHAGPAILAVLIPIGADWALDIAGLWSNTPVTRSTTGAAFGVIMGVLLIAATWPRERADPADA